MKLEKDGDTFIEYEEDDDTEKDDSSVDEDEK